MCDAHSTSLRKGIFSHSLTEGQRFKVASVSYISYWNVLQERSAYRKEVKVNENNSTQLVA